MTIKNLCKLLSAFGVLVFSAPLQAQLAPNGGEFQVNSYTTGSQQLRFAQGLTVAPGGAFVFAWTSTNQDGAYDGIFAQRFASNGQPAGTEFQVNQVTSGAQLEASVASDSSGNFVVVWGSDYFDGDGRAIVGRRYGSGGDSLGSEFQINTTTSMSQRFPCVDSAPDGDFVVAWHSEQSDYSYDVMAQRFGSNGQPVGTEFQVNTYTTYNQRRPSVAFTQSGAFVIVWHDDNQDTSGYGIFGQRFDSTGSATGTEFQINSYTIDEQRRPSVDADAAGNFVVVWHSYQQDAGQYGIFAQRFSSGGQALGSEFQVNTTTTNTQDLATVAVNDDGSFVVGWDSNDQDGSLYATIGKAYANDGSPIGAEFLVNEYTQDSQDFPVVRGGGNGDVVFGWVSFGQDGDASGVYARRYSAPTATASPIPTPTSTPANAICAATPVSGCATAPKAILKIKNPSDAAKRKMLWKWIKGTVGTGTIGDPTASTNYRLCVYDDGALTMSPFLESGAAWSVAGSGFKYSNSATNTDGVFKAILKEGTGNAKILVKFKGGNLTTSLPFTDMTAVTVQLVKNAGSGGDCWESTFDSAEATNTATGFKDKAP